jgi:hypothetical protein
MSVFQTAPSDGTGLVVAAQHFVKRNEVIAHV